MKRFSKATISMSVVASSSSVNYVAPAPVNHHVEEAIQACMALLATLPTDAQRQKALQQFLLARPIQERTTLHQVDPDRGISDAKAIFERECAEKRQKHEADMAALKDAKKKRDEEAAAQAAATAAAASPSKKEKKEKKNKHSKKSKKEIRAPTPDSSSSSSDSSSDSE